MDRFFPTSAFAVLGLEIDEKEAETSTGEGYTFGEGHNTKRSSKHTYVGG